MSDGSKSFEHQPKNSTQNPIKLRRIEFQKTSAQYVPLELENSVSKTSAQDIFLEVWKQTKKLKNSNCFGLPKMFILTGRKQH